MQATYDTILPKYQKTRLRTVGGVAFGVTPLIMRFFVHSSAARGRRWMKLKSNEFEPRWVITTKFHQNHQPEVGERARTPDRTTDRQTDKL